MMKGSLGSGALSLGLALLLLLAAGLLAGCAKDASTVASLTTEAAEKLAREGLDDFKQGRYSTALETFEKLKEQFPFSQYSMLAELKIADCKYHLEQYSEARPLYEEFEKNHPTNEAVPYVLFQIGMSYHKEIGAIDRNTKGAAESIQAFSRLLRTYPQSPYTEEATARIKESRDFLAAHELYVANFYIRTGAHKQAAGRLEYLLVNFPDTAAAAEARELQAKIRAGNPPRLPWHSWLPLPSLGWLNPFSD